jgi:glutamate-1-semialdehyde 2,1-aminomutase
LQNATVGTMFTTFFGDIRPGDWQSAKAADTVPCGRFFQQMKGGVYLAPSQFEPGLLSTTHTEAVIGQTILGAEMAFSSL